MESGLADWIEVDGLKGEMAAAGWRLDSVG